MKQPKFRLVIESDHDLYESAYTHLAILHLRSHGYSVLSPNDKWERPGEFCKRVGIYPKDLRAKIVRFELLYKNPVATERVGKSQRIKSLRSFAAFDNFCRRK